MYKMTGCNSGYHQSGNTCVAHSYTCPSGYQASACSSSQVQTGTTSKKCSCGSTSGTCYACRAKTCEEQGKKTCNGSCISKTQCCGGCPSGKKCSNGTCIKNCTPDYSAVINPPCGCYRYVSIDIGCGQTAQSCQRPKPCKDEAICNPLFDPSCR